MINLEQRIKPEVNALDKSEYQIKLDQITKLVEKEDYEGALEIVETIDWRRVKSVRTLCMVADIFEVNDMLEDSKKILLLAYKRSSIGKVILYRLVEISLKMGDVDDAVEFYTEYAQNAPGDNSKYILKYKIYKEKRAPLEDQIAILEEYKDKEYTERWAYELAVLYSKAGLKEKCIEECDDLILWFSEGAYVTKAMELKMKYQPLTPSQQEKYDNRNQEEEVVTELQEKKDALQQQTEAVLEKLEEAREEAAMGAKKAEEAAAEAAVTLDEPEQPKPFIIEPEKLKEKLASSLKDVLSGIYKGKEEIKMEYGSEGEDDLSSAQYDVIDFQSVKELEPENLGETTVVPSEELDKIKEEALPEKEEEKEPEQPGEESQEDMIQRLLEETANRLAQQLSSGKYIGKEKQIEKILDEDIFGTSEEKTTEEETVEEPEIITESEEVIEEAEEPVTEEFVEEIPEESIIEETAEEIPEEPSDEEVLEEDTEEAEKEAEDLALEESIIAVALKETEERVEPQAGDTQEFGAEELSEIGDAAANKEPGNEPEEEMSLEEKLLAEETPEERRSRILNDIRPEKFTDEQQRMFTYFTKVPGMDQQILDALDGVYQNAGDRTSRRGNIAVMGSAGSGKTKLVDSLVRAICCDFGLKATKEARISGSVLNSKDPAQIIGRLAGGFLLIENAGQMSGETVDKLSRAMEFRTDRLVLIIEDEKKGMRKLLADYPEFAKKFATVISIPVFTNDELVTFARTYASESGYKIDELGILALYTRIGEQQTEEEPMTVGSVKNLVDKAILKAHRGKLERKVSKKRLDNDGRIILFEKDFDF
jgi:DNA replication protein DnaC